MKAILLFLGITILSPGHRVDQKEPAKSNDQSSNNKSTPSQNQPTPTTNPREENKNASKNDNEGRANPSYWQKVISPDILPNWILMGVGIAGVFIGIFTLIFIYCQSQDTQRALHWAKKSAIAAKKSADAAFFNAQAVINAERAWIDGEIVSNLPDDGPSWADIEDTSYSLRIINNGRTAALISRWDMGFGSLDNEVRELRYESLRHRTTEPKNVLLQPRRYETLFSFDMAQELPDWDKVLSEQKNGVIEAIIYYFDTVSARDQSTVPRKTRFVYSY